MKFNISPGMVIFMLGFGGLVFCLVESSGEIASKIPLSIFFLVIMSLGILIEKAPKDQTDGVFGEVEGSRDFG